MTALTTIFMGAGAMAQMQEQPATEIQIFINYRGYNDYDLKFVSTIERPISAQFLYPSDSQFQNGACYKGDPEAALDVFMFMVDKMNLKSERGLRAWGEVYMDKGRSDKPALQIYARDEFDREFVWFERLRECDRWSTEDERANEP